MDGSFLAIALLSTVFATDARAEKAMSPKEIMDRVYAAGIHPKSHEAITMELIRENGDTRSRKVTLTSLAKAGTRDRKRLMVFTTPADIRGTAIFIDEDAAAGDNIWIYLPALHKKRRLPSGGKQEAFVGSDFNYGDIISPRVSDYQHRIVGEEKCPGDAEHTCYVFEHVPASPEVIKERGVGFYKDWIRKDALVWVRAEIKDADGNPWKIAQAKDVRKSGDARNPWQAMWMEIENLQSHHRSRLVWERVDVDTAVPPDSMSSDQLERAAEIR
jgi:hypothetical protein